MGPTVLDPGIPIREGLHVYAHCLRGTPGGVALLAINNSRTQPTSITLPSSADFYTLSAQQLDGVSARVPLARSDADPVFGTDAACRRFD